jgi:hypothetical protein
MYEATCRKRLDGQAPGAGETALAIRALAYLARFRVNNWREGEGEGCSVPNADVMDWAR